MMKCTLFMACSSFCLKGLEVGQVEKFAKAMPYIIWSRMQAGWRVTQVSVVLSLSSLLFLLIMALPYVWKS